MLKLAQGLIPVILIPQLITARKRLLAYFHRSTETPVTVLKALSIGGFFWILHASGRSIGLALFAQYGDEHLQGVLLVSNIWLLLVVIIYSFALPLAFNELFLNPDHELISASPYLRIKILFGRLLGIGLKIGPTATIIIVPTVAISNQLIPLGIIDTIFLSAMSIYLPSALAMLSSILMMAVVPSRKVLKGLAPCLLIICLLIPIGMPQIFEAASISPDFVTRSSISLSASLKSDLHYLGGFLRSSLEATGWSSSLSVVVIAAVVLIPMTLCLLLSYPLYGIAIVGSHRLRSLRFPHLRANSGLIDSTSAIATLIAVRLVRVIIFIFSSTRSPLNNSSPLPEKFIKAFLRQESLSIIRDPFKLLHLSLLIIFSLVYLSSIPTVISNSKFSVEFSSVINFALVGLLVASFANRFVITTFSREGEAHWIVHTAPLTASQVMLSRFAAWCMLLIPSGLLMGIAGSVLVKASLTQSLMLIFVITAGVPSLVSSALTSGLRLRNIPGAAACEVERAAGAYGFTTLFAMVSAAAVVSFNATLYLMIQLAHNQALSLFWLCLFLLVNLLFTKARLTIGVNRYSQQSAPTGG